MFELGLQAPILWGILAVLALIAEMLLPQFGCLFISTSAALAAIASVFNQPVPVQLILFSVTLVLTLVFIRPHLVKRALHSKGVPDRTHFLIGKHGVITAGAPSASENARVLVEDQDWAARLEQNHHQALNTGDQVEIVRTDGIVLIVRKTTN